MIDNTEEKRKLQAILEEHKAAYFANGGTITVVPPQVFGKGYDDAVIKRPRSNEKFDFRNKVKK